MLARRASSAACGVASLLVVVSSARAQELPPILAPAGEWGPRAPTVLPAAPPQGPARLPGPPIARPAPPPLPMVQYAPTRLASTGQLVGGLVLGGAGVITGIVGATLASAASRRLEVFCTFPGSLAYVCERRSDDGLVALGVVLSLGGVGAIVGAMPLVSNGGRRVSDAPQRIAPPRAAVHNVIRWDGQGVHF